MGLALMVVIWLITLVSTYFFVAKTWWLPVGAAEAANFIDGQFVEPVGGQYLDNIEPAELASAPVTHMDGRNDNWFLPPEEVRHL